GIGFGGAVAAATLVVAALIFHPRGITDVEDYDQIALILTPVFGHWGFILLIASLGIACFGAALELGLSQAYLVAQGFGWTWGEDQKPRDNPGFSTVYTLSLFLSALPIAFGLDPLKLTIFSMALPAGSLPLVVVPFGFLLN